MTKKDQPAKIREALEAASRGMLCDCKTTECTGLFPASKCALRVAQSLAALDDDGWIPVSEDGGWEIGNKLEVCNMRAPEPERTHQIIFAGILLPGRFTHWRNARDLPPPPKDKSDD